MPSVPYSGVPQVDASYAPTPNYSISTPPAAFGENVANAIQGLGKTAEGAGNELFARGMAMQDLYNHSQAQEAAANYMAKAGELHANYSALTGKTAVDAYPKYIADIQEARKAIRASLPNDMAGKMYDAESLSTMGRTIFNGAGHSAQQLKLYTNQTTDARIAGNANLAAQNPNDDAQFEQSVREGERLTREKGTINGASSEATDNAVSQNVSQLWSQRITELSKQDPLKAQEMLETNRDKLWYTDATKTEDFVKSQMYSSGARRIAAQETGDLYSGSKNKPADRGLEERVASAVDKAKAQRPNDPDFAYQVEQTTRTLYTRRKQDVIDTQRSNQNTVTAGIIGDYGGKIPTTIEELRDTDPSVAAAYDALPADKRRPVLRAIAQNAKGDYPATETTYRQYMQLRGMAISDDPAQRDQFMETSLPDLEIPMKWRSALNKQRESMIKSEGGDVHVSKAYRQLVDAGISPDRQDKDANLQFRGALQEALDDFRTKNSGRQPKLDELRQIGSQLMSTTSDASRWTFGGLRSDKVPFYSQGVPSADRAAIVDAYRKDGISDPTDTMINRVYLRKQYIKLYGTSPTVAPVPSGQSVPGVPQAPRSQ